jgi:hypothetical protein
MQTALNIEQDHDQQYTEYLDRLAAEFHATASSVPLFTTDANLWEVYLSGFPDSQRQFHNCNNCRAFIERFGGLVTIDEGGQTRSVFWHTIETEELAASVNAMRRLVEKARVTGVFLTDEAAMGRRAIGKRDKSGPDSPVNTWNHLAVVMPLAKLHANKLTTPFQAMSEKTEDAKNVTRALSEFSRELLAQAVELLQSDALYRSEKVLGPMKWLGDLQEAYQSTRNERHRENIVFRAVATAPAGFCHPRASMAGTLLEDLATGNGFDWAATRFRSKMHPLQYQRPQAAPSDGQIEAAEKLVEKLGIARSLDRRFARIDEIQTIWRPAANEKPSTGAGVFGHLKEAVKSAPSLSVTEQTMTWLKFTETVLPKAKTIQVNAPVIGNYCAYLTAEHEDAPPILQWDSAERRNQFSLYVYHYVSRATQWGISGGWHNVNAVSLRPSQWFDGFEHQGNGALLVIAGCVDSETKSGNALFPETLKSELHGCRSVIEAHSRKAEIYGREKASACGLLLGGGVILVRLRVTTTAGVSTEYLINRWD